MKPNSLWGYRILLGVIVISLTAFVLLLAELLVRWLWGDKINVQYTTLSLYQDAAYSPRTAGWKPLATGSSCGKPVFINSLGLRGPEIDLKSCRKKILLLGDSALFGIALEEKQTLAAILRPKLDECVLNAAVIGYNTGHYVDALRHWSERTRLDRAMVFFCLNDVQVDTTFVQRSSLSQLKDHLLAQVRSRSKLYMALKNLISDRSKVYFTYDLTFYDHRHPQFQRAMENMLALKSICEKKGIALEVVLLPYEFQLRHRHESEIWEPQEMLAKYFAANAIDYLRIDFPSYTPEQLRQLYLFADGIHFSAQGHQLIAEQIIDHWSRRSSARTQ